MPGTCTLCGEKRVEREAAFGGTYVGACPVCRNQERKAPRHVDTCEEDDCIVCRDYAAEFCKNSRVEAESDELTSDDQQVSGE